MLGQWRNFDEIEDSLNVFEINAIRDAVRKKEHDRRKFEAALHKGLDLDKEATGDVPTFEEIRRRAEAKNRGVSEEAVEFAEIGIKIIEE